MSLALDHTKRQRIRDDLIASRDRAPLFDSSRFARDLGALIVRMVDRFDHGLPPAPIEAESTKEAP